MKVLIVDDSHVMLTCAQMVIEGMGHEVITTRTPFGTSALVLREKPDVVLVDLHMPAMDGSELVKLIKKHRPAPRVYLFSNSSVDKLARAVQDSGADGYIIKGDAEDLAERLEGVL